MHMKGLMHFVGIRGLQSSYCCTQRIWLKRIAYQDIMAKNLAMLL
jgi:hypothetical protein